MKNMTIKIIHNLSAESQIAELVPDITVLILMNHDPMVKIDNLPSGLKYLVLSNVENRTVITPWNLKLPFGCQVIPTFYQESEPTMNSFKYSFAEDNILKIVRGSLKYTTMDEYSLMPLLSIKFNLKNGHFNIVQNI